ncbi:MAG TPA: hypothetical protein EYN66_15280 [Myxococcales bacterium]|nr:hypothetical protein [Myxococcales bacterium]
MPCPWRTKPLKEEKEEQDQEPEATPTGSKAAKAQVSVPVSLVRNLIPAQLFRTVGAELGFQEAFVEALVVARSIPIQGQYGAVSPIVYAMVVASAIALMMHQGTHITPAIARTAEREVSRHTKSTRITTRYGKAPAGIGYYVDMREFIPGGRKRFNKKYSWSKPRDTQIGRSFSGEMYPALKGPGM